MFNPSLFDHILHSNMLCFQQELADVSYPGLKIMWVGTYETFTFVTQGLFSPLPGVVCMSPFTTGLPRNNMIFRHLQTE